MQEEIKQNIYNIYIDEAGDEGFKFDERPGHGSSNFFVLSALIVKKENDLMLSAIVNELKRLFEYQEKDMLSPLHFVKMTHPKRKACVNKLADFKNFSIISVVCEKQKLYGQLQTPPYLYNFACKLLVERIVPFLKANSAQANLVFEHRRNTSYDDLKVYLKKIVDTSRFISLSPKTKVQIKCLQLADIIASSTYQAFEPDYYGNIETSYIMQLRNNIFCYNEKCLGYGLKLYPTNSGLIEKDYYSWLNDMLQKIQKGL